MQARGEIKPATGFDPRPEPTGFFKRLRSSPVAGDETPDRLIQSSGNDSGHVNEIRISHEQRDLYALENKEKVEEKLTLPATLRWPGLPGEKDSEDVANTHPAATWPSLPDEGFSQLESLPNQMGLHPSEEALRKIERLRALDEEQKGKPWSASHF